MVVAAPLADNFFRPAMAADGVLVPAFGALVGTGDGAGMSLLILFCALLGILVGAGGYLFRTVRDIEVILPDHESQGGWQGQGSANHRRHDTLDPPPAISESGKP
jgi:hypothetical protein